MHLTYQRPQKSSIKRSLQEFDTAEDGAARCGDKDCLELVKIYRQHGLTGDWHYPELSDRLIKRIA